MVKWHDVTENIKFALKEDGFALVHPFRLGQYNSLFSEQNLGNKLEGPEDCLCVLIGNTKEIWPIFTERYKEDEELKKSSNPFDLYCKQKIDSIGVIDDFVCAYYETDERIAIQKMAKLSGMAILDEKTHMCVNRKYGPWIALRAVVVFHYVKGPDPALPEHEVPSLTNEMRAEAERAFLEAEKFYKSGKGKEDKTKSAELWIKVRDCLTSEQQREYRYSEEQMNYHYDLNRNLDPGEAKAAIEEVVEKVEAEEEEEDVMAIEDEDAMAVDLEAD